MSRCKVALSALIGITMSILFYCLINWSYKNVLTLLTVNFNWIIAIISVILGVVITAFLTIYEEILRMFT